MAFEIYKDRGWLFEHYIKRRMTLMDIKRLLAEKYGIEVSHQTIDNWICKWELDKLRGRNRKMGSNLGGKKMKRKSNPFHEQQKKIRAQRKHLKRPGKS